MIIEAFSCKTAIFANLTYGYFFKRFFRGCISVIIAIALIMMMVFSWLDATLIFAEDEQYVKLSNNQRTLYMYQKWEEYDYLDYVPYTDWLNQLVSAGELSEEERSEAATIGRTPERDSEEAAGYIERFTAEYEAKGYTVVRLDAVMATPNRVATGGTASLFAYQNTPLIIRLWNFFTGIFEFDNINYVEENIDPITLQPQVEIDSELFFSNITPAFRRDLNRFQPFGPGNPAPVFVTRGVVSHGETKLVGADCEHLRMDLMQRQKPNTTIQTIAFQQPTHYEWIRAGHPIDVCYQIVENHYRGSVSVQLRIKDIKPLRSKQ